MDLQTCLKKMQLVGVLAFATVDSEGAPQVRNIAHKDVLRLEHLIKSDKITAFIVETVMRNVR